MLTPFIQLYGSGHVHGLQHNGNALLDFERDALHRETGRTLQGQEGHTLTIRRRWDALGRLQALASQGLQRHITHTVYEPETFTPLVQLSAKASAQARPHALMLAVHGDGGDDEGSAQMAQMLQALPGDMRHLLDRSIRQAAREGVPEHILALMPDQGHSALRSAQSLREQLEKQEQSQRTEITVRHYHCDHLGTPIALTDEKQNIVWAARLDPWGNVQEEFNPDNIEQSIRLPGQNHDKDTGLYYNRHRYYDPSIGSYINQDPIGWLGGINHYNYPLDASRQIDPLGLDPTRVPQRGPDVGKVKGWWDKAKDMFDFRENVAEGREKMNEYNLARCKSEKEIQETIKNSSDPALEAERQKAAEAAKAFSDGMAGPASYALENVQDKFSIGNIAKSYGMLTAPAKDCSGIHMAK